MTHPTHSSVTDALEAAAMREMRQRERNAAIRSDPETMINARGRFEARRVSVELSRSYRKPQPPKGTA